MSFFVGCWFANGLIVLDICRLRWRAVVDVMGDMGIDLLSCGGLADYDGIVVIVF